MLLGLTFWLPADSMMNLIEQHVNPMILPQLPVKTSLPFDVPSCEHLELSNLWEHSLRRSI